MALLGQRCFPKSLELFSIYSQLFTINLCAPGQEACRSIGQKVFFRAKTSGLQQERGAGRDDNSQTENPLGLTRTLNRLRRPRPAGAFLNSLHYLWTTNYQRTR